jgi:hypothetical protein
MAHNVSATATICITKMSMGNGFSTAHFYIEASMKKKKDLKHPVAFIAENFYFA